jgi:hypothetical protein
MPPEMWWCLRRWKNKKGGPEAALLWHRHSCLCFRRRWAPCSSLLSWKNERKLECMRVAPVIAALLVASAAFGGGERQRSVRPGPAQWRAPQCASVSGLPGVYFSFDEGRTVSSNDFPDPINYMVLLAATDVPNRLIAILDGGLYESQDGGCRWFLRAPIAREFTGIVAAPGGGAYAWSYVQNVLLRIAASLNDISLPEPVIGVGVDPADAQHLIVVSKRRVYESTDGGSRWNDNGPAPSGLLNAVAFDPHDVRHIAVGYTHGGAITVDGGLTWQLSDTAGANVFTLAFAPSDRNVVWMEGLVPYGAETVYRSIDGGLTYAVVLSASPAIGFNRAGVFPHPTDPDIVAIGAWEGLAIVEARSRSARIGSRRLWDSVTWSPVLGVIYLTTRSIIIVD